MKTFKVTVWWEVAYVADNIKAKSEDEAIEKVRQLALNAPSSDYQWLQETDVSCKEQRPKKSPEIQ